MKATKGMVTVIVPTKNRPDMLALTVESLIASPLVAEVIVVDDGSDEPVLIEQPRVRVLRHETSRGEGAAVNSGWGASSAEFVMVISDDDPQRSDLFDELLAVAMLDHSSIAWYPNTVELVEGTPSRMIPAKSIRSSTLLGRLRVPCLAGVLLNATALRARGVTKLRDESVRYPSDTIQWLDLSLVGAFCAVPSAHAQWWRHSEQASTAWSGDRKAREYAANVGAWLSAHSAQVPNAAFGALYVRVLQCLPLRRVQSYRDSWGMTWPLAMKAGVKLPQFMMAIFISLLETAAYRLSQLSLVHSTKAKPNSR